MPNRHNPKSIRDRFWSNIKEDDVGCWIWQSAGQNSKGYGLFWMNHKNRLAHRVAYELTYGNIPDGMLVCHKCNNVKCVRPDHLYLDTQRGNLNYARSLGRTAYGDKNGNAKLTNADVLWIRSNYTPRLGIISEFAKRYGVTRKTISGIISGRDWKQVK